jgi:hypothetical protein
VNAPSPNARFKAIWWCAWMPRVNFAHENKRVKKANDKFPDPTIAIVLRVFPSFFSIRIQIIVNDVLVIVIN